MIESFKQKVKHLLTAKEKGQIFDMFSVLFTAMVVCILLVFFASWMGNLEAKDRVNMTARQYMLSMETYGYLSSDIKNDLMDNLTALGVSNIDISGTTMSAQDYGATINLCIKGKLQGTTYGIGSGGLFSIVKNVTSIPIDIELSSTSKH